MSLIDLKTRIEAARLANSAQLRIDFYRSAGLRAIIEAPARADPDDRGAALRALSALETCGLKFPGNDPQRYLDDPGKPDELKHELAMRVVTARDREIALYLPALKKNAEFTDGFRRATAHFSQVPWANNYARAAEIFSMLGAPNLSRIYAPGR